MQLLKSYRILFRSEINPPTPLFKYIKNIKSSKLNNF